MGCWRLLAHPLNSHVYLPHTLYQSVCVLLVRLSPAGLVPSHNSTAEVTLAALSKISVFQPSWAACKEIALLSGAEG